MTAKSPFEWPPLETHLADQDLLGYSFSYPDSYLRCIKWAQEDLDAGGDGHWLTFLVQSEVQQALATVRQATTKRLVPFARGDNGDSLFCFDAENPGGVYAIDLGEEPLRARIAGSHDFIAFVNDYRARQGLEPWTLG
jgi:hypothetical protein